ncbi:hypothetical protein CY34DRAFT_19126 [Suillus luteus UH-Slu-Lm8-n1]|uniref:Uncharacterized protein n=1 Tax=Suillus luteus UH-Slu-Lm8-n1 TaxID=930992 RepID=A0A0C9ZSR5_9AGAM|nr:hypothetical protein CY34DRAFT_19126 [Suillus luteus UH-Slu-Lm8-n1]
MLTDQAAARADAPKPSRPRPCPVPVKKAAKAPETTDLTTAVDKAVGGRADKSAASANNEYPGSEADEEEVQMPGARKKKGKRMVIPVKTPVRDAIDVAGSLITRESTQTQTSLFFFNLMVHDNDASSPLGSKKFSHTGRIPNWRTHIPIGGSNPSSNLKHRASGAPSAISSTAPSSKLTKGSTTSSGGALLTPIDTPNAGANNMLDLFTTLFADDKLTDSVKHSQALLGVKISWEVSENSLLQTKLAHRNANLAPKQLDLIEPDIIADDSASNLMDNDLGTNAKTTPLVTSLVNYDSGTNRDSDLEPPPSAQVPKGYYDADLQPPHLAPSYLSRPTVVKCKLVDAEDDFTDDDLIEDNLFKDDLMITDDFVIEDDLIDEGSPSSKIEFVAHIEPVVKTEYKSVSLWLTSAVVCFGFKYLNSADYKLYRPVVSSIPSTVKLEAGPTNPSEVTVEILPRSLYRIKHLPGGPRAVARWSAIFIPTLISAIGDQEEVWGHIESEAMFHATIQNTWNAVHEDIPHTIPNDGPVVAIALQRLSEWRNCIGTTAVTVYTNFMSLQDDVETDEDCKGFSESLLVKLAFLYGNITEEGKFERPFESELIIQALSAFALQRHVEHAIRLITSETLVSELEVNSKGKAIKIPHSMNKSSGKISSSRKAFSDTNFGVMTRWYMTSINRLQESVLQDVWGRAKDIALKRRGAPPAADEDSEDERVLIGL